TIDPGSAAFPTVPVPSSNFGIFPNAGTINLPGQINVRHVDENIVNAYAHFWSLAFEREVMPQLVASVEYSGSAGRHLYDLSNDNRIGYGFRFLGDAALTADNPLVLLNKNYYPLNT